MFLRALEDTMTSGAIRVQCSNTEQKRGQRETKRRKKRNRSSGRVKDEESVGRKNNELEELFMKHHNGIPYSVEDYSGLVTNRRGQH